MGKIRHRHRREHTHELRYLTFSCYDRLPLFRNDAIKAEFVESIARARHKCGFGLIAWVVMPEHAHLLIWPRLPEWPVSEVLRQIKMPFARRVLRRWRELNAGVLPRLIDSRGETRFWQRGGGYDRNEFSDEEVTEKVKYIHLNPVRRGLVEHAEDWKWSSVRHYRRVVDRVPLPCDPWRLPGSYVPVPSGYSWDCERESVEM